MTALHSPAAERNKDPILAELRKVLPASGAVLEIASGSGQHVVHFARHLPDLTFMPSDPTEDARSSIETLVAESRLANVEPPRAIDVLDPAWTTGNEPRVDAIVCINMIHISPAESLPSLLLGASRRLGTGGVLVLYGPFRFHGQFLAPSNAAFSEDLKRRNPSWGVRDVDDVAKYAEEHGFSMNEPVQLPANNHLIVLRRAPLRYTL
jgi:cyclopropane fatty-acyl-phospholipid synthase-like methyltransferase